MPRAILIVLDSVGCGAAPDAPAYGDEGADTLGHIAERVTLHLPHLAALGLGSACEAATGRVPRGLTRAGAEASWGYAVERSPGKDTPSGHWELAGTIVPRPWGYFPRTVPCFPTALTSALMAQANLPGILGERHDSGTAIIAALGEEHMRTGRPICYTSADSVFQIAAHEETFGLKRLYETCRVARTLCDALNIGRVIARPFVGTDASNFRRTANRKDFAVPPPANTLLQRAHEAGRTVLSIGKIGDIFARAFTGEERKAGSNDGNLDLILEGLASCADGGLVFANLVDFDTDFGHRRDVSGYAACLERFDARLPEIMALLEPDDLLVITADHGNDPTWRGTDHTRELVPVLACCATRGAMRIGRRNSFADVGASLAHHLGLEPTACGRSWLDTASPA